YWCALFARRSSLRSADSFRSHDGVAQFRCADQWIAAQREKHIAMPIPAKRLAIFFPAPRANRPHQNLLPDRRDAVVLHFLNVPETLAPSSLATSSCVLCLLSVRER